MAESIYSGVFGTGINFCIESSQEDATTKSLFNKSKASIQNVIKLYLNSTENLEIQQKIDFSKSKIIGRGCGSLHVKTAELKDSDTRTQAVVCKTMEYNSFITTRFAVGEVYALLRLKNKKNIIQMLGAFTQDGKCYIILELGYTNMHVYARELEKLSRAIPKHEISAISRDMYSAISYCKDVSIYHKDIHLGNWIAVYTGEEGRSQGIVKLADFGCSEISDDSQESMLSSTTRNCLDVIIGSDSNECT